MNAPRPRTPQAVFTEVARVYDVFNACLSVGRASAWRNRAAQALCGTGARYLDVGAGTGTMTTAIRTRAATPDALVVGCDLNSSMLRMARRRDGAAAYV